MSILGAMFSGVSGLTAQSQALGAIADNITNQNTIGYKAIRRCPGPLQYEYQPN